MCAVLRVHSMVGVSDSVCECARNSSVCRFNFKYSLSSLTCLEGLYWKIAIKDFKNKQYHTRYGFGKCPWQTCFIYLQCVCFCIYLNRTEAALAACVATSRQEEEMPAITDSETATNPGPLGKRRTLGGCLHTHTQTAPPTPPKNDNAFAHTWIKATAEL